MKKLISALAFAVSFPFCAQADVAPIEQVEWNGHTYTLLSEGNIFEIAAYVDTQDGYLVAINSEEENQFIVNVWWHLGSIFLGANDVEQEGVFTWDSGEVFDYDNWQESEPNNTGGNEDYAMMYLSDATQFMGLWNDVNPYSSRYSVLEYATPEEEPIIDENEIAAVNAPLTPVLALTLGIAMMRPKRKKNQEKQ
jgi:hypothetical protein